MKKVIKLFILMLFLTVSRTGAQQYIAGAEGAYLFPYSGLAQRFLSAPSYSVFFGKEVSQDWTWLGKLEYFKYSRINEEKYHIKRIIQVNSIETEVTLPLQDTTIELSSAGLSANASYNIIRTDLFNLRAGFGFGIYRWESSFGSYHDTLYYTDSQGNQLIGEVLKNPPVKQIDWSGGFNIGFDVDLHIYGPLWFNTGASYKNIIGELWAVLSLDMENVSTFQMFQTKAGLFIKL